MAIRHDHDPSNLILKQAFHLGYQTCLEPATSSTKPRLLPTSAARKGPATRIGYAVRTTRNGDGEIKNQK